MKVKMKQIGVSLSPVVAAKLLETAKLQERSASSVAADAITAYLAGWIKDVEEEKPKKSLFTGLDKHELIQQIQESA